MEKNHMTPEEWRSEIATLQKRADMLAPMVQWPEALKEAMLILQTSLEELHVAEEEMRQQHETVVGAQQAVLAAHQRYQQLFDLAPDEHLVTDSLGMIQEVNQAAAALLNCSPASLVGTPLALSVPQEERRAFRAHLTTLATARHRQTWTGRLQPQGQRSFAAELTSAAIPNPQGDSIRLLWLLRDITKRLRAEEALRQASTEFEQRIRERTAALAAENNAVKRLAYTISQDLRAPLVTMHGFVNELRLACDLLKTALPPLLLPPGQPPQSTAVLQTIDHDIPEALEFIVAAVTQMDSRIQAMLDFSRR
jgi:PAS domain S-box-containing protein